MSSFEADAIDWIEVFDPPPTTTAHNTNILPVPPPLQEPQPIQTIMPPPPPPKRDEQMWQELRRKLEEKEEALFELSATLLTVEAEASSRIQQTERQAHDKIRLAEEQLRRAQMEANVLRVRRTSKQPHSSHAQASTYATATTTISTPAIAPTNHKQSIVTPPVVATAAIRSNRIDAPTMTSTMATTNHTRATISRHVRVDDTADETVGSRVLARHLLLRLKELIVTGRIRVPPDSFISNPLPKKGTKRPLSGSNRTEPMNVPTDQSSSTNDDSLNPPQEHDVNKKEKDEKTKPFYGRDWTELQALLMQVALPGPAVNDCYNDSLDTLLRHLFTLLVRQLSRVIHSKSSSSFVPVSSVSSSRRSSRAYSPKVMGVNATHGVEDSTDWRNTNNEVQVVLRVVRELLTLSWEARQRTRQWIQQSHHVNHHDGPTDNTATRSCSMTTTQRIHLGKKIMGANHGHTTLLEARLERAATQLRETMLPSSSHSTPSTMFHSQKRRRMEWDSIDRNDTCQLFVLHLTALMKGTPPQHETISTGAKERLANSKLQMEAIQLFLVLMSDEPPNNEDSGENNNNNPWTLWFQSLVSVPCNDHGTKSKIDFLSFLEDNLDISTAAEEVNSSLYSRQRYIRKALQRTWNHTRDDNANLVGDTKSSKKISDKETNQQQQVPSSKMGATDDSHTDWNVEEQQQQRMVCWNVKSLILQTLTRFLLSSKAVRQTLFQEYPSDPQVPMTLARRILAAVLDNLQDEILPQLRLLDNNERTPDDRQHVVLLDMCISLMRLFFILAQQTKGIVLLQTKMAIGGGADQNDEDDGQSSMILHAPSGVTLLIDLLQIAVDRSASCGSSLSDDQQQPCSKSWSALVNHVVRLFHLMLADIQRMRHVIETGKQPATTTHNPSVTTLLSITLDRREMFLTCCHLILQAPNIDNETKWYARMLLDEISYDEEEEEEMQHSVNDDT